MPAFVPLCTALCHTKLCFKTEIRFCEPEMVPTWPLWAVCDVNKWANPAKGLLSVTSPAGKSGIMQAAWRQREASSQAHQASSFSGQTNTHYFENFCFGCWGFWGQGQGRRGICHKWNLCKIFLGWGKIFKNWSKKYPICEICRIQARVFTK